VKISSAGLWGKLAAKAAPLVGHAEAEYFAREVVEAHLRKSPRTNPLKEALDDLAACVARPSGKFSYRTDLPAYLAIDFAGHGTLPYIKRIHDELEIRANQCGLAMAAFTNSQSMHTLHTWVQGLAKRGLVAIAVCNGGPGAVVPFNGTKGVFGTNPMAYGLPGADGVIRCVDMATSEIPYFQILRAHKSGQPLPSGAAVDQTGQPTTIAGHALDFSQSADDPIANLLPIGGGYKGYYLVFLLELLTSGLIGMPASPQMSQDKFVPEEHGAILLAFSPQAMGTKSAFAQSLAALESDVKRQPAKAGAQLLLPGETNNQRYAENGINDLEIEDSLVLRLTP
jgi:LDH2 family malate/lactate/ureidoglycolate dehydrogenase